jgi:hypothetical protein
LPDQIHPLLLEDERTASGEAPPAGEPEKPEEVAQGAPAAEATSAAEAPTTPEETVAEAAPPPAPPLSEEDLSYRLRRGPGLYQDIAALYEEDQEFKQRISEFMGRKTKRVYEVRLRELEAERDALLRAERVKEIEAMPQERVDELYRTDKRFATEYTDLFHGDPIDPDAASEATYYEVTRDEEFDRATRWLTKERIADYDTAFGFCPIHKTDEHGFYDHDEQGHFYVEQFGEKAGRMMSFDRFRGLLNAELAQAQRASRPTPQQQAAPVAQAPAPVATPPPAAAPADDAGNPNPALVGVAPDTSNGSRPQAGRAKYTAEEVRNMNWEQRFTLWPNDGDYERAVESGEVSIPGLNAPE